MDSFDWKLDFSMQILLAHALRSEAGLIRQHFPQAGSISKGNGQELIKLNDEIHLLRTGIGLDHCQSALRNFIDSDQYDLLLQFGVSGSLTNQLPIFTIIQGQHFFARDKPDLSVSPPSLYTDMGLPVISFYSSLAAISDEQSRGTAISSGAEAVDMESYSAAHFCIERGLPMLTLRCISDRAGASTSEDFKQSYSQASKVLQEFLLTKILKKINGSP